MSTLRSSLKVSVLAAALLAAGGARAADAAPAHDHAGMSTAGAPCSMHHVAKAAAQDESGHAASCACGHATQGSGWQKSPADIQWSEAGYQPG